MNEDIEIINIPPLPVESFDQICRTCLIYDELFPIKDVLIENLDCEDILNASIQFENHPELPQKICTNCIRQFYEIDKFLKQCKQSQLVLQNSVKNLSTVKLEEITVTLCENFDEDEINEGFPETIVLKLEEAEIDTEKEEETAKRPKGPYHCEICSATFNKVIEIRKHWQSTGHQPRKFSCKFCTKRFSNNYSLTQHVRTHTGEKPYCCEFCKKRFTDKCTYRRHLVTHTNSRKFKCSTCGKGFIRSQVLKDHERKYHAAEKLLCPFCGKEFTSYGLLRTHENKEHLNKEGAPIDPNNPLQCKKCGKIFATTNLYREHEEVHLKKTPYPTKHHPKELKIGDELYDENKIFICEHCKQTFNKKHLLRSHLLDSDCTKLTTLFPCKECDTVSISKGAWYFHQSLHKDEKKNEKYDCKVCGKSFSKKCYYQRHFRTHSNERKFMCSCCGLGFFSKKNLAGHQLTHTGEKPYVCDICNKPFAQKTNMKKHRLIHDNVKPFKCGNCERYFRDPSHLKRHVKSQHANKTDDPLSPNSIVECAV